MVASINRSTPQDERFKGLKEVAISKIIDHLTALKKMVGSKPSITPVFLVNRTTGEIHEESFESRDWFVTFGLRKNVQFGYYRRIRCNRFDTHIEEYNLGEIPYRVFVTLDQPLPEITVAPKKPKKSSKNSHGTHRR